MRATTETLSALSTMLGVRMHLCTTFILFLPQRALGRAGISLQRYAADTPEGEDSQKRGLLQVVR